MATPDSRYAEDGARKQRPGGNGPRRLRRPGTEEHAVSLFGFTDGSRHLPPIPLEDYWIDKYEVTNRQFKQFLDQGGYRKQQYWKQAFLKDGQTLSWEEAMALFKDRRADLARHLGSGRVPTGQDDFPVTGVSWFEAAAYAEFAGK